MSCPHCYSTNEPKFSRELPMGYFCPDCGGDPAEHPLAEGQSSPSRRKTNMKLIIHSVELSEEEAAYLTTCLNDLRACDKQHFDGFLKRTLQGVRDIQSKAFLDGVALGKANPNISIAATT